MIWNIRARTILDFHGVNINGVACGPDDNHWLTWTDDGQLKLWNASSHQVIAILKPSLTSINGAAFSPDKKLLFVWGIPAKIVVIDWTTRRETKSLNVQPNPADSIAIVKISADGKFLAGVGTRASEVKLWDLTLWREAADLKTTGTWITTLVLSPDSKLLALGDQNSTVSLWDVQSRTHLVTLRGHASSVSCVAFSPDSKTLATGSQDNTVKLWNCLAQQQVATFTGHPRGVSSVDFSPDGQILASASGESNARLWHAASFAETDAIKR